MAKPNIYAERLVEKADELLHWLDRRYLAVADEAAFAQEWQQDKETFRKYLQEIAVLAQSANRT